MSPMEVRRRLREERGVYTVLYFILIVAIFTILAIVVDLGSARAQRRSLQRVVDLAALAGGPSLPGDPQGACKHAWNYLKTNLPDMPSGANMAPGLSGTTCEGFPTVCLGVEPGTTYTATGTGDYTISFLYPVPDADIAPPQTEDGIQCERLRLTATRKYTTLFGSAFGANQVDPTGTAVVRMFFGRVRPLLVALLVLDPFNCDVLTASGQAEIRIMSSFDGVVPGRITLDSEALDGSAPDGTPGCSPATPYSINAIGIQNSKILAFPSATGDPAQIELYGIQTGQFTCLEGNLHACEQADIDAGRVSPFPVRSPSRITRAVVDHVWNCRDGASPYPLYHTILVPRCNDRDNTKEPWVDHLIAEIGNSGGLPTPPNGGTFQAFRGQGYQCTYNPNEVIVVPEGNWYVDCPQPFGFRIRGSVTFLGGNIVFEDAVEVKSSGSLRINVGNTNPTLRPECQAAFIGCAGDSSELASYVYFRRGTFEKEAQSEITLNNTMVYINHTTASQGQSLTCGSGGQACMSIAAGTGEVIWTAPVEGPFKALALWSESSQKHLLGGQANLLVDGVFFTPESIFEFQGQGCQFSTRAQFISYRLTASGQGCFTLEPDPAKVVLVPDTGANLIR